ncbi:ferrous iron transport protein A [Gordonibacter sp. An230]|uniref:FeoA family protein n=1 Tax=Gordonibacter sp. An230 TaxID=1965592 RepID=UPI000B3B01B5|nr:FeoA family protein [Gordonibacter sp. An230]OUO92105.1 ferrous iron transport protein A [Gordonibacter sp. An230]
MDDVVSAGGTYPLPLLHGGEEAVIVKVGGRGELHHRLEALGFVEGASVIVVSEAAGNLIVEVKGTRVALDRSAASRIMARAAA